MNTYTFSEREREKRKERMKVTLPPKYFELLRIPALHFQILMNPLQHVNTIINKPSYNISLLFGPVVLVTNRCGKGLPALLGCAAEGLDEAPMLGGLQDGIPMY